MTARGHLMHYYQEQQNTILCVDTRSDRTHHESNIIQRLGYLASTHQKTHRQGWCGEW